MAMNESAREVLRGNDRGGYTVPTGGLYPYQWNWDSAFSALGLATFDRERAWQELETLFEAQWPDGMVPHIVFRAYRPNYFPGPSVWQADRGPIPSSGISQPPVVASVVRELSKSDPERANGFIDAIDAWHEWWHRARDPEGAGVIAVTHPWESGRDNLPDWDLPGDAININGVGEYQRHDTKLVDSDMRPRKIDYDRYIALVHFGRERQWDTDRIARENPFFVADPGVTSILLRAEKDLCALADRAGRNTDRIKARIARMENGIELLWNKEACAYVTLDMRTGFKSAWATSASFLPLYAGVRTHADELISTLDVFASRVRYLVPSFDPRDERFDHIRYWRGPAWGMINFMIGRGLRDIGENGWAERIRSDTRDMIRNGGFSEYFSPIDGRGCGGGTFSWTAAIWLAWELDD